MTSDLNVGVAVGFVVGVLLMLLVILIVVAYNPYPSNPVIFTGSIAAAPSASLNGGHENILLTLSNNPNTVINCMVNLGYASGPTQVYDLMTLKVGQHISLMRFSGNCTVIP